MWNITGRLPPHSANIQEKIECCHPHFQFPAGWHVSHLHNQWSSETTMIEYIENVIIPSVENVRKLGDEKSVLAIIDNFKGQRNDRVFSLLESHNIHVVLLPPNCTDVLQPMEIAVNRPAKAFLKWQFEEWYTGQILDQVGDRDIESVELEAIDLKLGNLKEIGAKWKVNMGNYIASNPQLIVSGFLKSGISDSGALDGHNVIEELDNEVLEDVDEVSDDTNDGEEPLEATGTEHFTHDPPTTSGFSMDNPIVIN